MGNTHIL